MNDDRLFDGHDLFVWVDYDSRQVGVMTHDAVRLSADEVRQMGQLLVELADEVECP